MKPILFNTEMVRAILEGRKTVTRRVVKNKNNCTLIEPFKVGDVLYVRETWTEGTTGYIYKASSEPVMVNGYRITHRWHPSIHMPKAAARIFLKVTGVRVERLRDMTTEDILKEGINTDGIITNQGVIEYRAWHRWYELWDSTIKKSELNTYGSDSNPYVWVIEFEPISKEEALKYE